MKLTYVGIYTQIGGPKPHDKTQMARDRNSLSNVMKIHPRSSS